jgi:general secretion pathway protein G
MAKEIQTSKQAADKRNSERGMTLLELLVVLAILALVIGIAAPRVIGYLSKAKSDTALLQMRQLVSALNLYRLDVGSYPTEQEGLQALVAQPAGAAKWNGPYIDRAEGIKDPWGQVYGYKLPGEHGEIDLATYGADRQPGGDGENRDIGSWE